MSCCSSGWRLRKSTAATLDSYGQSTENSTLSMPSAMTVQRKAGGEKLPLQVTTRFSVRYCAGVRLRPRRAAARCYRGRRHARRLAVARAVIAAPGADHLRLAPADNAAFKFEAKHHVAFAEARGVADPVMR